MENANREEDGLPGPETSQKGERLWAPTIIARERLSEGSDTIQFNQQHGNRHNHNFQIQQRRSRSYVSNVNFYHFINRRSVLPGNLPKPGQARQCMEAFLLPREMLVILAG